VSESLHLNVMYLGQLFKKETKKSFSAYLNHLRMEKAKQLLKESGKSVPEVSEAIGYPAHEHFQKLFKKKIGKTPSAYRKENSEKV